MSSGSGDKPPGGTPAPGTQGRPGQDTPNRLVVRSHDSGHESAALAASDTAVALGERSDAELAAMQTPAAGTPALSLSDLTGATLAGRYLVTRKVGQGGMGAVYEATHTLIGKQVAVKVLLEKYAQREAIVKRLKQEAQLAASLKNEHIIDVADIGNTDDGRTFVVMEFLDGESLAECLAREVTLPEQRILRIAAQTASALSAAHAQGIVHRDIKPENLFLLKRKEQDFVKVVDFGISKSLRASDEQEERPRLTQTGMVLGTPLYMSPEQARGDENLDHRVDIYALGVIMYECACGHVPFTGTNYLSVISQVLNEEPRPVRQHRPELSDEFEAIVMRAMAKDRTHRYESATDMLADLTALLDDPTHSTERAKITGPRRLLARPKIPKLAYAIGGIGFVVGGVAIAVVLLMGGGGPKRQARAAAAPVHLDAGVVAKAQPPDAAPAPLPPAAKTIDLMIVSDPPGATIWRDSENLGKTPQAVTFVLKDKDVHLVLSLDGYKDGAIDLNPLEHQDKAPIHTRLEKLPKGAPHVVHHVPGGTGAPPDDRTAGDLHGNPYAGSGSLPKQ